MTGFHRAQATSLVALVVVLISTCGRLSLIRKNDLRAKEATLKEYLYLMRNSIDQYTQEKSKAPQDLHALVRAGYMHAVPKDPITNSSETWQTMREDVLMTLDQTQPGITDVHSGSTQISSEGTPYSSW
jgi:general secretion pathway protein G